MSRFARWRKSKIRDSLKAYREALEEHYIAGRPLIDMGAGQKAFSLLCPALGSAAGRRRLRYVAANTDMTTLPGYDPNRTRGNRIPHSATIAISYACQCDCAHCSAHTYREKMAAEKNELTVPELQRTIGQAVDLGVTCVVLTGGEPLLHPRLGQLIRSVDRSKSVCTIFTNGELLTTDRVANLKQDGLFGTFVSFDFPDAQRHDSNRRRDGIFANAVEGIKRCQDAGILTGLSTYVTREKMDNGDMDALLDLGRELGVLEVFIFDVIPTGRLGDEEGCALHERDVQSVAELRTKYNAKPEYPRIVHQSMFVGLNYPCIAQGCPAAVVQVHVRANGDVTPCDFTPYSFGNVREQPLEKIWQALAEDPLYAERAPRCRMADPDFRRKLSRRFEAA